MLAPEHQFFLYENLKLHLEAARLALARHDPALYRDNLTVAADWLARYFEPEDPVARAVANAIEQLRTVDIRPELPDISHSLRALQVRQKLLEDLAPAAGETS
jgi:uroporphyrin-3 C-methyltransferase